MAKVLNRHHNQRETNIRTMRCKCPACKCPRRQSNRNSHRRSLVNNRCRECRCRKTLNRNSRLPGPVRFTRWSNCSNQPLNTIPPSNRPKPKSAQSKAENGRRDSIPILLSGIWGSRLLAVPNVVVNRVDSFSRTSFWAANSPQLNVSLSKNAYRRKQNEESSCSAFRMPSRWLITNRSQRRKQLPYEKLCAS